VAGDGGDLVGEARFIAGQSLLADGGFTIAGMR
jgi:hypothetical protein